MKFPGSVWTDENYRNVQRKSEERLELGGVGVEGGAEEGVEGEVGEGAVFYDVYFVRSFVIYFQFVS